MKLKRRQTDRLLLSERRLRTALWEVVDKRFTKVENRLFDWLVGLFTTQEERYIDAIKIEYVKTGETKNCGLRIADCGLEETSSIPKSSIRNPQFGSFRNSLTKEPVEVLNGINKQQALEWHIWKDAAFLEFTELVDDAGKFGLKRAKIQGAWDVLNPQVLLFLDEKVFNFANGLTDSIGDALRETLREAIRNGESIEQMTERIQKVFQGTVRGDAPRARMIARTEATGIVNGGQRLAYQQNADIVEGVEWLSSKDARVRPSHQAADGQQVLLNKPFTVGGALLRFPGDPQGPAREVVNCRCTILSILKKVSS